MHDCHKASHPKVYRSYIESFYLQLSLEKHAVNMINDVSVSYDSINVCPLMHSTR